MVQVLKERRLEQLFGAAGLLFLATLFNSQGLRLLCLGLALKTVILRPQDQTHSQRLVIVSVLGLVAIYLGSLPGLLCLVLAEFANHFLSGRLENGELKIRDLGLEVAYLIPLLLGFFLDLGGFRSAEIAIYVALALRMTRWPLNFKVSKPDGVDNVLALLFGLAIVKTVSFTSFENWYLGAAFLIVLSGMSLNLSHGASVLLTFFALVKPSCAVFFAPALFCVEEQRTSTLILPVVLIPSIFLVQPGVIFGDHWWVAIPFLILSLRGYAKTTLLSAGQSRQEDVSAIVLTLILLGLGLFHLQREFGSIFVSERIPEFVLSAVVTLALPIWAALGKMKSALTREVQGLSVQKWMDQYAERISFGDPLKDERLVEGGGDTWPLDRWTSQQRGPIVTLLSFIAAFVWGVFWIAR